MLIKDIVEYRKEFNEEWRIIYTTFQSSLQEDPSYEELYPGLSDPSREKDMKQSFLKAFITVVTRCFGWGLPKTTIIPFADCINHHNVDSTYELIHLKYHRFAHRFRAKNRLGDQQKTDVS